MTKGHRSEADLEVKKEKGLALLLDEAEATLGADTTRGT